MEIIYKSPSELKPFQKNPYNHPEKQLTMLKKSMREFGFTSPVLISQDNMVIAGHARLKAAQEIGLSEVPTIFIDLPYEKAVAYVIADNQLAKLAEEDRDLLGELLQGINDIPDFDIEAVGFSSVDLDSILGSEPGEVVEDEFTGDPPEETDIQIGDIFNIGNHWLMCGDAANRNHVNKLIQNNTIDLIYYDPPYEIPGLWALDYPCKKMLVFSDNRHIKNAMQQCTKFDFIYEFVWDNIISWYLDNRPLCRHRSAFLCSNDPGYDSDAMVLNDGKERKKQHRDTNLGSYEYSPLGGGQVRLTSVFSKSKAELPAEHGKPVEWISPIIAGARVNNVLDLFGGAGSTIIACEQVGIPCFTMEIDPIKCQHIKNRIENYLQT